MDLEFKTVYKYVGCNECKEQWRYSCPICKRKGNQWRDENGDNTIKTHKLSNVVKDILERSPLWAIIPIGVKSNKSKKVAKKPKSIAKPKKVVQPLPITIDNFFISTYGVFKEIEEIPKEYYSFFKSTGSEYFRTIKGDVVIRKSDHWGNGINNCSWFLEGHPIGSSWEWKKNMDDPIKIGMIEIWDLKPNIYRN